MIAVLIMGTFNPATRAHIYLGELVERAMPEADVWYVPAMDSFLYSWKSFGKAAVLPGKIRAQLLREAIAEAGLHAQVSEIEIDGKVDGKTVRTAAYFRNVLGYEETYICLGTDKIPELERWETSEKLVRENHFLIVTRNGERLKDVMTDFTNRYADHFREVINEEIYEGVASTKVREAYMNGQLHKIKGCLPDCVFRYLTEHDDVYLSRPEDAFDAEAVSGELVQWVRRWFDVNGPGCNAIIGLSGGRDSAVVAALSAAALGKSRVIGVILQNGNQKAVERARKAASFLDIRTVETDITGMFESARESAENAGIELSEQAIKNLRYRLRMSMLYAVSQSNNGRVSQNENLSRRRVGFTTRFGDDAGDFGPLANLTATEVELVGRALKLPEEITAAKPCDMMSGLDDEENLGFSYGALDRFIRTGVLEDVKDRKKIEKLQEKNLFKLQPISTYMPDYK